MLTSAQAIPIELHAVPLSKMLCQQLCHQNAITTQTLDHIFHWFHLLWSNNNGSQPPDAISYLTLLTNQLHFTHQVHSMTIDQLIHWVQFQCNIITGICDDIWTLDSLQTTNRQDINNLQQDIRTNNVTNFINKRWINNLYDCRDNIG